MSERAGPGALPEVEIRDLAIYDALGAVLFTSRERLEALLQDATAKEASYADFLDTLLSEEGRCWREDIPLFPFDPDRFPW